MQLEINNELIETNRQFLNLFSRFDEEQINEVPFAGSWTPAQVAEHVIKSETFIKNAMNATGKVVARKSDERVPELKNVFLNFNTKLQSPQFILPEEKKYDKKELIEKFNSATASFAIILENINSSEVIVDPALGELTKEEMTHFVVYHTQRHIHQLQTIFQTINKTIIEATSEEIVRNVNDAFNRNDMQAFLSYCTDDIRWNMIGSSSTQGKDAILKMMNKMPDMSPDISVNNIFVAGNKAACTGTFLMTKHTGEKTHYSFCDIYQFAAGKIAVMDSYVLPLKGDSAL